MIKIEKRNDVPMALYFFTPFIAIILTILGGGIIFYILGFNPIEALKFYFITPISNLYGLSELLLKATTKDAKIMPKGLRRPKKATIIAVKP